MKKILAGVFALLIAAPMFAACSIDDGDTCTTDNDCGGNLLCQEIAGHGLRCCPAPPESSDYVNCHAVDGGTSPISTAAPLDGG